MDAEEKPTNYLELKEFLARNPCVKPRTFARWKKRKLIDFIQPGGPGTLIFVPQDALVRMEQAKVHVKAEASAGDAPKSPNDKPRSVRQPKWKKHIKPQLEDINAKEE